MRIAIVGAGIAGLSCAEVLQGAGHPVVLFDKGRGAGGRTATRRVDTPSGEVAFDHGAQYFTARDPAFVGLVAQLEASASVARWRAIGDDAWVGTPGMNAMARAMAMPLTIHWNSRIDAIRRVGRHWALDPVTEDRFDAVIIATPAEQAAALLAAPAPDIAAIARACVSAPCWTAMVAFDDPIAIGDDVIRDSGIIGWAARNSAKPGRSGREAWVIQANEAWSREHLEDAESDIVDALLAALSHAAARPLPEPFVRLGHRWRYARVNAAHHGSLWDGATGIGATGDWLTAPRIESAWLSGRDLANRMLGTGP
ncbi:NAD(P)/FAD-dependent oxidoreductase [Sphingomonas sp. GB1N7]|uniref:NAD(P)/FAD-dependent oxidoreductase n=1 Tax=Parasphingomonas caseinilytica TaxID=3096158 RepID=UPI002FCA23C8